MRLDQLGEAVVDLRPHLVGHHRFERRIRQLEREVARALVAGVDDRDVGRQVRRPRRPPTRKCATALDRVLRGRQADAQQPVAAQRGQALERQSARCAPRLFGASAWISSTITMRVVASILRPDSEPSRT